MIWPEFLSTQMAKSFVPSSGAAVIQIWSPHTTGLLQPLSCSGVFHLMFCVSLHFVGSPLASDMPSPLGPRNCGQLSAAATGRATTITTAKANKRDMRHSENLSVGRAVADYNSAAASCPQPGGARRG